MSDGLRDALFAKVGARSSALMGTGLWPCRAGCDHCCRSLAAPLPVSEPEWRLLEPAIAALPPAVRDDVVLRAKAQAEQRERPYVCALLDLQTGRCRVYDARPVACRSYGFYARRDGGDWCEQIEAEVAGESGLMFGNSEALAEDVAKLGPTRPLFEKLGG